MPESKAALKRLSYGVYVVSACRGGEINAMTVRMISQVASRPLRLAVSIAKRRHTHAFITESRVFAINILAKGQEMIGGHFGLRTGRHVDKFAGIEYSIGETGCPILDECSAFMECRVVDSVDLGNCTLFIAEPIRSIVYNRAPLVYRESDYFG